MSFFGGPKAVNVMTPGQNNILESQTRLLNRQWQGAEAGRGIDPYSGQIAPGATGNQMAAFNAAGGLLGRNPIHENAQGATIRALSGQPAFTVDPAAREQYYRRSVENPARASFNDTLRNVDARYGDRWSLDAGAHKANVYDAVSDFETGLAGIRGDLLYQDEMAQRQSQENAANRSIGAVGAGFGFDANQRANLGTVAGLGGAERSIEGQQLGEDYNKWLMSQPWANPWLGYTGQVMSAQPFQVAQEKGVFGSLLGGAGSLLGGIGGLL